MWIWTCARGKLVDLVKKLSWPSQKWVISTSRMKILICARGKLAHLGKNHNSTCDRFLSQNHPPSLTSDFHWNTQKTCRKAHICVDFSRVGLQTISQILSFYQKQYMLRWLHPSPTDIFREIIKKWIIRHAFNSPSIEFDSSCFVQKLFFTMLM